MEQKHNELDFYEVDTDYLAHLKSFDTNVPNYSYDSHNKFFCGVVLTINGFTYFAPVSSFNKKQATNYPIMNNDKIIATIRFSFMIPVVEGVIKKKDFSLEEKKYAGLLSTELTFCRQHQEQICKTAKRVYQYGIDPSHRHYKNCCQFKLLETAATTYLVDTIVECEEELTINID